MFYKNYSIFADIGILINLGTGCDISFETLKETLEFNVVKKNYNDMRPFWVKSMGVVLFFYELQIQIIYSLHSSIAG